MATVAILAITFVIALPFIGMQAVELIITRRRLNALRRNAYLTDADGVRRRYANVSPEVRARAESN